MGQKDKPRPIMKWMQQLCEAAVALGNIGYAHGDINPRNILFDDQDNVRLVDIDHALKIGEKVEVVEEPYVRRCGAHYGIAGAYTEQFALGSVLWYLTRGKELYSDINGAEQVNRLSRRIFPEADSEDPIDAIISDCWQAKFDSMAALARRVRQVASEKSIEEKKKEFQQYYLVQSD